MTIRSFLKKGLSIITDAKIYISRIIGWLSIGNSLMIIFLFLGSLSDRGIIKTDLGNSYLAVVTGWFVFLVILGWFEVNKVKAPHVEAIKMLELNPPMKDIYLKTRDNNERLKRIEERLDNENKKI